MLFEPAVSHSTNSSNPRVVVGRVRWSYVTCGPVAMHCHSRPNSQQPARAIASASTHSPELSVWHPTFFSLVARAGCAGAGVMQGV